MLRALLEAAEGSGGAVVHELTLGAWVARVVVDGGVVRSVTAGPFSGEDALFRLLLSDRRAVRTALATQAPTSARGGAGDVGAVGVVVARFDDWARDLERAAARAGGFSRRWAVRYLALKTVLGALPDEVKRVVRLLDGTRDLRTLLAESPLPAPLTLRVVERLLQQGTLERADLGDGDGPNAAIAGDSKDAGAVVDEVAAPAPAGADRSWLEQRATAPPTPAPPPEPLVLQAKKKAPTTETPAAPTTEAPTTETTTAPTTETTTAPTTETTTAPTNAPTTTAPTALAELPAAPKPAKPELSSWLGPEDAFFSGGEPSDLDSPRAAPWPLPTLVGLVALGALVGAVVARSCVG